MPWPERAACWASCLAVLPEAGACVVVCNWGHGFVFAVRLCMHAFLLIMRVHS